MKSKGLMNYHLESSCENVSSSTKSIIESKCEYSLIRFYNFNRRRRLTFSEQAVWESNCVKCGHYNKKHCCSVLFLCVLIDFNLNWAFTINSSCNRELRNLEVSPSKKKFQSLRIYFIGKHLILYWINIILARVVNI